MRGRVNRVWITDGVNGAALSSCLKQGFKQLLKKVDPRYSHILNQCVSACLDCVLYVSSVPLRVSPGPPDWLSCFRLAFAWWLLIGPHYQLAASKSPSPAVVPLAATGSSGSVFSLQTCSA